MKRYVLLFVVVLSFVARTAAAETRRIAVVVGNNAGSGAQAPLRYAETDAGKVGRVLVELGGVAPADLLLLQGRDQTALKAALAQASSKIAAHVKASNDRVMLFFYFSGHSDGVAIEQGSERFSFADLRKWLASTGAQVRLTVIDACKSGAFLGIKGGTPGPSFQIRLADELSTTGEAFLTSSAADEIALESGEIGGSFFTHHLVSGLRGAADTSGDGRVTLSEAFDYAYARTLRTTSVTLAGAQHPSYDYRLAGQGEFVLTELTKPAARIDLASELDRAIVVHVARDQVLAEVTSGAPRQVALAPGRYAVRAWRGGQAASGAFTLSAGETIAVSWKDLSPVASVPVQAKGESDTDAVPSSPPPASVAVFGAVGVEDGASSAASAMPSIRVGVRSSKPTGPSLAISGATGSMDAFDERLALGMIGYRVGARRGVVRGSLGLEAGGGIVIQNTANRGTVASGIVGGGPVLGGALQFARSFAFVVDGTVSALAFRRDGTTAVIANPAAWLGVEWQP